jgi:hypothetical protein
MEGSAMKIRNVCLAGALLLFPLLALSKPVQLKGQVYSPDAGVICDCKTKQCKVSKYEDKIDAAQTKALFGK